MATRSTLSIINEEKKVETRYIHWDGYLSYNGHVFKDILFKEIESIIKLNKDMSSISLNPDDKEKENLYKNNEFEIKEIKSGDDIIYLKLYKEELSYDLGDDINNGGEEYNYLKVKNELFVNNYDGWSIVLNDLSEVEDESDKLIPIEQSEIEVFIESPFDNFKDFIIDAISNSNQRSKDKYIAMKKYSSILEKITDKNLDINDI